ncbi:TPA: hypothetical protein RQN07_002756 [Aeromonas dhakensis]|uniref:hypothetical protein n=1 Tax=Aeromonas dhakensis TaxID=196024 RepID=UPI00288C9C94|nr:hypothetical protein [Aeromonas dhakensis]HDX8469024.1 hypothetical protein [Aeromonas dhakensis]HDZ8869539.1 hypothetical protein [Aeromonas dhakensis]HDZ8931159.1 hypothetical protein [Aeromonas dhakensis]HEA3208365.1 hypothetical protein [Aeromonas dhakensis]
MSIVERLEKLDNWLDGKRTENFRELLEEVLEMKIPEAIKQKIVYELLKKHGYI